MIVMPANVTSPEVRGLAVRYPGMLGNLFSPGAWQKPFGEYALDNGRFSLGPSWSRRDYIALLERATSFERGPMWALVPDVVGDWKATVRDWDKWLPVVSAYGFRPALAVQDGATVDEVRAIAPSVVFVGGSTKFKIGTVALWTEHFPHVHVGRVNTVRRGWECYRLGVMSVDGTGWMRTTRQRRGLRALLRMMAGEEATQENLWRTHVANR